MRLRRFLKLALGIAVLAAGASAGMAAGGDVNMTARERAFDDASWRALDLPHDWSIEDLDECGNGGVHEGAAKQPTNVLAVRVRNEGKNTRWYSGLGIHRHCWLTVTEPIHLPTGGLFVKTAEVSTDRALVKISSEVRNGTGADAALAVRTRIADAQGKSLRETAGLRPATVSVHAQ